MVGERRAPGVKHGGNADAGAEMLRVGCDGQHRLRRRAEQEIIDKRLVLKGDGGDLGWQREDDMEVADRQQIGLALGEPCACRRALTLGKLAELTSTRWVTTSGRGRPNPILSRLPITTPPTTAAIRNIAVTRFRATSR
jgi:hypothetical protein